MKFYKRLYATLNALKTCYKNNNTEWIEKHEEDLLKWVKLLPHGSGIDGNVRVELSKTDKILITFDYHCMDENGYYCGWIEYKISVSPDFLCDINIKFVKGRNYDSYAKDYLLSIFYETLTKEL